MFIDNMSKKENTDNKEPGPLRILIITGSARTGSLNARLANLAADIIVKLGANVDVESIATFECPSFNQDIEKESGITVGAQKLRESILRNDAFIIASPEYNASMPGHLKHVIDWVSRFRPQPFNERHAFLMSASPSMAGGNRGLWSLRIPLEHLGTRVYPGMFSLAMAHKAFTDSNKIQDETLAQRFEASLKSFLSLVEAAKHYPCIKNAWIEFLGEKPDPAIDRVE